MNILPFVIPSHCTGVPIHRCPRLVYHARAQAPVGLARHGAVAAVADDQRILAARNERSALAAVRWPWSKRPPPPKIPPYQVPVAKQPASKDPGIVVEEVDTSQMTRTGIHRAWDRMTGKFKE
jgi:hypothetical protein